MRSLMLTGVAALALAGGSALAEGASSGDAASSGSDPQIRDSAMQSATGIGMQDVAEVEGAFVLDGTSGDGAPVLMVVGPSGDLLAIAAPLEAFKPAPGGSDEPTAGEPAETGYMATQAKPASVQAWDPASAEAAMRGLDLGLRGVAGQVSEPSQ